MPVALSRRATLVSFLLPLRRNARFRVGTLALTAGLLLLLPGGGAFSRRAAPSPIMPGPQEAGEYGVVVLRAGVADRRGRPVAGARVRFAAELDGTSRSLSGTTAPVLRSVREEARTGADGVATVTVGRGAWFRGEARVAASLVDTDEGAAPASEPGAARAAPEVFHPLDPGPRRWRQTVPAAPGVADAPPVLRVYELPDYYLDGFPVWLGSDGKLDRVVVLVEVFDLYNGYSATDNLLLIESAGDRARLAGLDRLRAGGVDVLVVNYPTAHRAPDELAPLAARAVRSASAAAAGRPVAVAGVSAGGIVARWALCAAENAGDPLPANLLLLLDTPNRGGNVNPLLQAMALRYGTDADRAAIRSDASRALLRETVTELGQADWEPVGLPVPLLRRLVPRRVRPDTKRHEAFFRRLHALNDRRGYPKGCRVVSVANSARRGGGGGKDLMHLWLPGNQFWNLPASEADREAGSLLPVPFVRSFRRSEFGSAGGAYLRSAPTFVSAASALDAGPGETPPFDAYFALPDGSPARGHDDVDSGAAAFVVKELLAADWAKR